MDKPVSSATQLSRRAFLCNGSLMLIGASLDWTASNPVFAGDLDTTTQLKIGLVTDMHYADKPPCWITALS